jgi:ankyrin repeat protein
MHCAVSCSMHFAITAHVRMCIVLKCEMSYYNILVAVFLRHLVFLVTLQSTMNYSKLHPKDGISALMLAVDKGHASVVKVLIDAKAEVNLTDNVRRVPSQTPSRF